MLQAVRIGVIGDFNPGVHTHPAIATALGHSAAKLGVAVSVEWVPTPALQDPGSEAMLERFHGLIAAPGGPYRSFEGMLRGIEFARTRNWPFSATWGGFQHTLVECARNVLKLANANSAEIDPGSKYIIISPVLCAVPQRGASDPKLCGPVPGIRLKKGSLLQRIYGRDEVVEQFFCNYEVNPEYEPQLASAGLQIVARAAGGEARAVELAVHRFFIATLFQPQLSSTPEQPHPLIAAFLQKAAEFAEEETESTAAAVPS